MTTESIPGLGDIDLSALEFWARPLDERMTAFAALRRREHPVFFTELPVPFVPSGKGYWALVRHADVSEASRHPDVFTLKSLTLSVAVVGPVSRLLYVAVPVIVVVGRSRFRYVNEMPGTRIDSESRPIRAPYPTWRFWSGRTEKLSPVIVGRYDALSRTSTPPTFVSASGKPPNMPIARSAPGSPMN